MSTSARETQVVETLITMIAEVLGEEDFGIAAATSFRDDIGFQSIQFVALAELVQEQWPEVDFVGWLTGKQIEEVMALRVGDVASFIAHASPS
jgi:acyl carrier protein